MLTDEQRRRFEPWVLGVLPRATAYALTLTRDRHRAEEVVQECLFRLLRKADDYDLERDGARLLYTAINNLCINQATRRRTMQSLSSVGPDENAWDVPDPREPSPESAATARELEGIIRAALDALPEMQRAAVELRALGLSKEEIGAALDVTPSHAGVLVFRGRAALKVALGDHPAEPP